METVSIETGHNVEWSSEVNYMFKLSAFKEQLLDWIDSTPYRTCVHPLLIVLLINGCGLVILDGNYQASYDVQSCSCQKIPFRQEIKPFSVIMYVYMY